MDLKEWTPELLDRSGKLFARTRRTSLLPQLITFPPPEGGR